MKNFSFYRCVYNSDKKDASRRVNFKTVIVKRDGAENVEL